MVQDLVRLHVTAGVPIRVTPLAFAGRIELRFGNAFPAVLVIDHDATPRLTDAIATGLRALDNTGGQATTGHNTMHDGTED
ncbi:hypothetical protein AB0I60_16275 [Actinosynnema sp. NPDC050436]|uniref:hypothetical protein n=1 Tax=Actinosynnema sp. NPDC050436 TaxID=3155659 RepID=UPI0034060157